MRYHGSLVSIARGIRTLMVDYDDHRHYYNKNKYLKRTYAAKAQLIPFSDIVSMDVNSVERLVHELEAPKMVSRKIYRKSKKDLSDAINLL